MGDRMLELLALQDTGATPPAEFQQFARFVGSWHIDAEFFDDDETSSRTTAEWHFAPILGGRALQDVLIFPARADGEGVSPAHRIGTSIRFYDASAELWKVVWISPQSGTMYKLSGGRDGDRIVLHGDPNDGEPTQWIFEDIDDESFTWRGIIHNGTEWTLLQLMHATRLRSTGDS